MVWAPPHTKIGLRLWSGLHEIFCAIQKCGFLTCILCRKLPSKLEFYQKFQVNSLLSFRVKHFSAAATELLATMSNLQLLQAKVFSDAQKNVLLFSTPRYSTSSIIRSSRDSISSKPERISKKTG